MDKTEVNLEHREVCYGGVEGPPHMFFNIVLSHTDDLVTPPYDLAPVAISYDGLTNSFVRHKGYLIRRI